MFNPVLPLLSALLLMGSWLEGSVAQTTPPPRLPLPSPSAAPVRFPTFGDMGTGAQIQYKVSQAIERKCAAAGCDFAVTLGDNIYNNGVTGVNDAQFASKFEKPYANLPFRFYMVLGNHDYRGNVEAQVAYTQRSSKWYLPKRYYSFRSGPVSFLALDTNQPDAAQLAFVKDWLKTVDTPWRVAFGHHPRYTNSAYRNTQSPALKTLLDSLCGEVDLYLAGHEHDKQHLKPVCGMEHLIVGTGAGLRKVGTGPNTLFARSSYGFGWVEATSEQMRFELLNQEGQVEYRYTLPARPRPRG